MGEIRTDTNRKWQNHFKAKGFLPFMYDRLLSYSLSLSRQYEDNPFNFKCENNEENPLVKYFFEFIEKYPYEIFIEITNSCNLNCIFCARKKMKRKQGFMSLELYKKIIDEIARERPFSHIHLYGVGESTIDPYILDKIRYAIDKEVTNLLLFTNGRILLKDEFYKKLVDTGIRNIGIDFDGFSKETYEKVRRGGNFEELKKSVELIYKYVKEKKLNTRIELAYQIYEGVNEKETDAFCRWANEEGYEFKFIPMHQWGGLRDDIPINKDKSRLVKRDRPCTALWSDFMILWNGDVTICFQDAEGKEVMGNLNNSTIKEVWTKRLREKRREHVNHKFTGMCENCKEYLYNDPPTCNSNLYPKELRK